MSLKELTRYGAYVLVDPDIVEALEPDNDHGGANRTRLWLHGRKAPFIVDGGPEAVAQILGIHGPISQQRQSDAFRAEAEERARE